MSDEQNELHRLRQENQELKRYKTVVDHQKVGSRIFGSIAIAVWLGPSLSFAFKNFFSRLSKQPTKIPIEETAELVSSLVGRIVRVGIVVTLLALVPSALLYWQNLIMKDQYGALLDQISAQREAVVEQQITQYFPLLLSEDQSNFWAAVSFYSSDPQFKEEATQRLVRMLVASEGRGACAALRALEVLAPLNSELVTGDSVKDIRQLAIQIMGPESVPNLGYRIRDLSCPGQTFERLSLDFFKLEDADLRRSTFFSSSFIGANLSGSDLRGAYFSYNLWGDGEPGGTSASLYGADIRSSRFDFLPLDNPGVSMPFFYANRTEGALFEFDDIRRHPISAAPVLEDALCLPTAEALECYEYHKASLFEQTHPETRPLRCPEIIAGAIVSYLDPFRDHNECAEFLSD